MTTRDALRPLSLARAAGDPDGFARALNDSFTGWGFAVVADHGVDPDVIAGADAAARAFFALPDTVKRGFHVPGLGGARGYTPFGVETAKDAFAADLKEFWHVGRDLPPGHRHADVMAPNLDVAAVPNFHARIYALFEALDTVGRDLLRAVARGLGLPPGFWDAAVAEGNSVLRLLRYPPVAAGAAGVRAEAHQDINVLTLLLGAEEAGLEILDRDGRWLAINPRPGELVVNVADMLQRQTNHVLPSTTHRVVNPAPERAASSRFSTPFFLHFAPDHVIETSPSCVTSQNPNRYPEPITADAYLQQRLREIKLA